MEEAVPHTSRGGRRNIKLITKDTVVLRRMRIFRGIERKTAAEAIDRSMKIIERFENGRANLTEEQKKALVRRYRFTWQEYLSYLDGPCDLPDKPPKSIYPVLRMAEKERRKYQRVISKEVRVLRVMRRMAGLSQTQAARRCGHKYRTQVERWENGHVDLTEDKITHIVRSYGFKMDLFRELVNAPMLRDEILHECHQILSVLDNDKLRAVKALLDNFR